MTEPLEHVLPAERDAFEQKHGVTYCRRCGSPVVNDKYPDLERKPCREVKIELRAEKVTGPNE